MGLGGGVVENVRLLGVEGKGWLGWSAVLFGGLYSKRFEHGPRA